MNFFYAFVFVALFVYSFNYLFSDAIKLRRVRKKSKTKNTLGTIRGTRFKCFRMVFWISF